MTQEELFKKLIAHCKEYGFIFPSSEIYDGLGAVYDYGQNGVELKNNIKRYWWDSMVKLNENIVGIDAEMAAAIADKLGMKLVIDDMKFDAIITAVQTGKSDMGMAGMTVTEDRLKKINFSETYATGIQSIIVKEGSEIKSVDDLYKDGAKYLVGTQKGTTGDIYSEGDFGADRVMKYASGNEAVQALLANKVDCVIIDNEPAKAYVEANNK